MYNVHVMKLIPPYSTGGAALTVSILNALARILGLPGDMEDAQQWDSIAGGGVLNLDILIFVLMFSIGVYLIVAEWRERHKAHNQPLEEAQPKPTPLRLSEKVPLNTLRYRRRRHITG